MKTLTQFKSFLANNMNKHFETKMFDEDNNLVWDAGSRELVFLNTVDFGFKTATGISYCKLPNKANFRSVSNNSFKILIPEMGKYLEYTLVS